MILVKDLGMLFPTSTSKQKSRYGIFMCPKCLSLKKYRSANLYSKNSKICRKCAKSKHGLSKTPLYFVWKSIKQRCTNSKDKSYEYYGARGISICKSWINDFKSFYNWAISNGYLLGLTIDRINNDGNYDPNNCRWVKFSVQNRNNCLIRRNNTSGYRGVCYNKKNNKFNSQIRVNNKLIHLGSFSLIEDAAMSYNNYVISNGLEHTINTIGTK